MQIGRTTGALLGVVVAAALALPASATTGAVDQAQVRAAALATADPGYLVAAEPAARAVAAEYGIPASVTAAQAILESSWGRSTLAAEDHNHFGYKCSALGPGPIATGCREHPTTECTPDCHPATAAFRTYDSMGSSFRDYGRLITTSQYYAAALPLAGDANAFITEVAKKYATDPAYADKVIKVMRDNGLYRLDSPLP